MPCDKTKFVGRDVVLEYAIACGDVQPDDEDYKVFGSMRTKEFTLEWETADATDADSVGSLRENLATFQNLTISGDGTVKASGAGAANLIELTKHCANPVATSGQPSVWMRMTFPDLTFTCYMLLSSMSRQAPYDDVVTYSMSATATASDFGLTVEDTDTTPPEPVGIVVSPEPAAISVDGATLQFTANVLPSGAVQTVTWTSSDPTKATINSSSGLATAVADGTTTITATSTEDGAVVGTSELTVSGQT